jgi:DNA-binding MarR family transcriptional regulator
MPASTGVRLNNQVIMIEGGVYENITLMITPGIDTPMGTHELGIEAYRVRDTDTKELLEKFIVNVEIKYRPDLVINYDDLVLSKTTPIEYEEIYINATIYNIGDASAKNVTVTVTPQAKGGSLLNPIGTHTIPDLAPQSSTTIGFTWEVDPSVEFIIVNIDPDDDYVEISETNNEISKNLFVIHEPTQLDVDPDGSGISYVTWGVSIIVTAVIVTAIAASAFMVSTEYGKYAALKMLIPLYSRVKREDVLNHEVREQVYDYVKEHPGDHFRSILTHLELTNGTLVHHLNTLEKKDFIRSERDGPYKRFYPIGTKISGEVLEINGLQGKILDVAAARPGITQKGLAKKLGASTPTINYHVKALRNSGLLKVKRDGKVTRCYVEEMIKVKGKGAS